MAFQLAPQIPVTVNNEIIYDAWRAECRAISTQYFGGRPGSSMWSEGLSTCANRPASVAQDIYADA